MEWWSGGVVEYWSIGVMERCWIDHSDTKYASLSSARDSLQSPLSRFFWSVPISFSKLFSRRNASASSTSKSASDS